MRIKGRSRLVATLAASREATETAVPTRSQIFRVGGGQGPCNRRI